jgi:hypothetical protein
MGSEGRRPLASFFANTIATIVATDGAETDDGADDDGADDDGERDGAARGLGESDWPATARICSL